MAVNYISLHNVKIMLHKINYSNNRDFDFRQKSRHFHRQTHHGVNSSRICCSYWVGPCQSLCKAERTPSPHDMNRQGLPLLSTPFNHRSVSQHRGIHITAHTESAFRATFLSIHVVWTRCALGLNELWKL